MYRYIVSTAHGTDGGYCYIYDRTLLAECGLPRSERNVSDTVPLRWHYMGTVHEAGAFLAWDAACRWLWRCIDKWGKNPAVGHPHPADVDWQAVGDALSAAARGQEAREVAVHEHTV